MMCIYIYIYICINVNNNDNNNGNARKTVHDSESVRYRIDVVVGHDSFAKAYLRMTSAPTQDLRHRLRLVRERERDVYIYIYRERER